MEALSTANTGFALDFFRQECKMQANRNILFSPLSIASTMATVYLGAKGSTAAQMAEVSWNYRSSLKKLLLFKGRKANLARTIEEGKPAAGF